MDAILRVIAPVFAIVAAGFAAGRLGWLGAGPARRLNDFVFWIALPLLLFVSMARAPLEKILHAPFLAVHCTGLALALLLAWLAGRFTFGRRKGELSLYLLIATFSNTAYMGIPICLAAFGPDGVLAAVIATVLNNTVLLGLGVAGLETSRVEDRARGRRAARTAVAVARSPLLIAPALGLACSVAGLSLPPAFDDVAFAVGPLALFVLGRSLVGHGLRVEAAEMGTALAIKLLAQPIVVFLLLRIVDVAPPWGDAALLLAALPTGALVFVVAQRYGVQPQRASTAVVASTALSFVTLSAILWKLG
jgi:predicted permease